MEAILSITFLVVNAIAILTLIFQAGKFKGTVDTQIKTLANEVKSMREELQTFNTQCKQFILNRGHR